MQQAEERRDDSPFPHQFNSHPGNVNIHFTSDGAISVSGEVEDLLGGLGSTLFSDPLTFDFEIHPHTEVRLLYVFYGKISSFVLFMWSFMVTLKSTLEFFTLSTLYSCLGSTLCSTLYFNQLFTLYFTLCFTVSLFPFLTLP